MGDRELRKRGLQVSPSPKVVKKEWINKRTGAIEKVPVGIDPGWDHNPGKHRQESLDKLMAGKLKAADPMVAETARRDLEDYRKKAKR